MVLLPFLGALMAAVRGRALGFSGASVVTCGSLAVACVLAWIGLYEVVLCRSPVTVEIGPWFQSGDFGLTWSLAFDDLTMVMCCVVLTVATLVHLYSVDYMAGDPHGQRFMALLSYFTSFFKAGEPPVLSSA